jgi:hypothetical protein
VKRTEPTVSLLARKPDGTPAREYVKASHQDLRATFLRLEQERQRASFENGGKTGWPPGLLQDDCKGLSRWLASKPDARAHVRDVSATLERENVTQMRRK